MVTVLKKVICNRVCVCLDSSVLLHFRPKKFYLNLSSRLSKIKQKYTEIAKKESK